MIVSVLISLHNLINFTPRQLISKTLPFHNNCNLILINHINYISSIQLILSISTIITEYLSVQMSITNSGIVIKFILMVSDIVLPISPSITLIEKFILDFE